MRAEIETGHARPGQLPGRLRDVLGLSGQGEDRSMVVRVSMEIEEDGTGGLGQFAQKCLVTTFAEVDDALDGHAADPAAVLAEGPLGPPGRPIGRRR